MGGSSSKPGSGSEDRQKDVPSIVTYDVLYLGDLQLPEGYSAGLESVQYALPRIKKECREIQAKVSLVVSVYGIKAMRTSFAGMKQDDVVEIANDGVSFDFVCNESIYRVAFGADVGKEFCFVAQDKSNGAFRCYAFGCKSKKLAAQIADNTALSCQRVFNTLALLKAKLKTMKQANVEVDKARVSQAMRPAASSSKSSALVELIHHEGYVDADERFKSEMLAMAGMQEESIGYVQPNAKEYQGPSKRTQMRQADPNEYERTRF